MINIKKFKTAVKTSSKINRTKVVSIEEARQKVADKLDANLNYINSDMNADDYVDTVFSVNNGTYTIGAKYGNRWLHDLFGEGENYVTDIAPEKVEETVAVIKKCVLNGDADDSIKKVMVTGRRKKAA